jgi:hypothetical protein
MVKEVGQSDLQFVEICRTDGRKQQLDTYHYF